MWPVTAHSSPRPDSVGLSSNDNGCKRVIKHRDDVSLASISNVAQRLTEVCWGVAQTHITSPECPLSVSLLAHDKMFCISVQLAKKLRS